jgi:hypothetical protein
MSKQRRLSVATALAACGFAVVTSTAPGAAGFSGKVCPMLGAKTVASVHVPAHCTQQKTVHSALGTVWTGVWGTNKIGAARLSVGIDKASAAFLKAATSSKAPGKPVGIGKWSGETGLSNGRTADGIIFVVGQYYVTITLNTDPKRPLKSAAPFVALAKIVAKQL